MKWTRAHYLTLQYSQCPVNDNKQDQILSLSGIWEVYTSHCLGYEWCLILNIWDISDVYFSIFGIWKIYVSHYLGYERCILLNIWVMRNIYFSLWGIWEAPGIYQCSDLLIWVTSTGHIDEALMHARFTKSYSIVEFFYRYIS